MNAPVAFVIQFHIPITAMCYGNEQKEGDDVESQFAIAPFLNLHLLMDLSLSL